MKVLHAHKKVLSPKDEIIIEDLGTLLKFSVTQKRILRKSAENYVCHQQKSLKLLHPYLNVESKSKYQVNQYFHEIISVLTQA